MSRKSGFLLSKPSATGRQYNIATKCLPELLLELVLHCANKLLNDVQCFGCFFSIAFHFVSIGQLWLEG
jgi:hypothetical protein